MVIAMEISKTVPNAPIQQGASLLADFPPLLTLVQLASLLDRSPNGLRLALAEANPYAIRLNAAKLRIGRRVYFLRAEVERFLLDQNRDERTASHALEARL